MKNSYIILRRRLLIGLLFLFNLSFSQIISSDDFDSESNGNTSCNSTQTLSSTMWSNASGDNKDWVVYYEGTNTSNTGPSYDHTQGNSTGKYLYTEATSCYNKTANLVSGTLNLSTYYGLYLDFYYHMYGSSMGSLFVDISTNGGSSWTTAIWSKTGQQHSSSSAAWTLASVDLSSYTGYGMNNVKIRIRGLTGTSFNSDMAIDDISIYSPYLLDAGVSELLVDNVQGTQYVYAILKNYGMFPITSATVNWSVDGMSQTAYSYTGNIAFADVDTVQIGTHSFTAGSHTIVASTNSPNSTTDQDISNDTTSITIDFASAITLPFNDGFEVDLSSYLLSGTSLPSRSGYTVKSGSYSVTMFSTGHSMGSLTAVFNPATNPRLSLSYFIDYFEQEFTIEIQEAGSYTWTELHSFSTSYGTTMDDDIWIDISELDLTSYDTESGTFKIRLNGITTHPSNNLRIYVDDFEIYEPTQNDLAANAILSPAPGFQMDSVDVTFEVYNCGTSAQSGYSVSYSINGGAYVTETVSATINSDTIHQHTFTNPGVFSATGNYNITAIVSNTGDSVTSNDTMIYSFVNQELPYTEGFESSTNYLMPEGWTEINTTSNAYMYTGLATPAFPSSYNGSYYFFMNNSSSLTGDFIAVMPRVYSGVSNKAMKFWLDGPNGNYDLYIGVLTDPTDASTWTAIDTVTPTTSYAQYSIDFSTYTGIGQYIGFKHSFGSTYDGYYIDDIELYQSGPNEMAMLTWDAPIGLIDGSTENIIVSVCNKGIQAQSNVPVQYYIDGGTTIVTETIAGPIAPGDTVVYTFTQHATFASGVNNCGAFVSNNDPAPYNDSVFLDVNNRSMPYMTGFENDVDGEMPKGWTSVNTIIGGYVYADDNSYSAYDGSFSLHMYNSSAHWGELFAVLPKYTGTISDKWIHFRVNGEGSDLITGVMTDPTDPATFVGFDTISPNGYVQNFVTFPSYTGSGQYIAFKHGMNSTYDDFYIDELVFEVAPTGPVYTVNEDTVVMNNVRYNNPDTNIHTVTISNTGIGLLNIITPTLNGPNATNFSLVDTNTYPKDLALNESLSFDVKYFGSLIGAKTAYINITAGANSETILLNGEVIDPTIDAFPYAENFDDQAVDIGWELRTSSGDFNWLYDMDYTASSLTGPSQDVTGGYYIYSEASSPASQGDIATVFNDNPIDLSSLTAPKMNYWYHMYGSEINTFAIEVASGGTWTILDVINGEQMNDETDPWIMKSIDLSSYSTIDSMKFYVVRGSGYYGDVALDNIAFGEDFSIDLGADTASCAKPITLIADSGNYTYEWINMADTSVMGTTQSMTFDSAGTYVLNQYDIGFFMGTDTINFTINPLPMVSFTGLDSVYCGNTMIDTLTGMPAMGTFSGVGMVNNHFDPSMAGVGTKAISYSYTDANGCTNTYTENVVVNGPSVDAGMDQAICEGDTATLMATALTTHPFFSEYQEGSSNHKAIEIYNGTGVTIDLDNYKVLTNYNGNSWSGIYDFPTGTTLADGDVWVIANSSADSAGILVHADEQLAYNASGYMMGYNGDDVRALVKFEANGDTTIIDMIGLYNLVDPGSGWNVAGVSSATSNHTLVRKPDAGPNYGDFTASQGTDSLSSEWLVYPQNTWSYLGYHTTTVVPPVLIYAWNNGATTASIDIIPVSTMSYTVTVTNSDNNCYNMDSVEVMVNTPPTIDLGNDTTIKWSKTLVLDAGSGFASYLWNNGWTNQTLVIDSNINTNSAQNIYYVDVTANSGCMGSDTIVITVQDDTGIEEIDLINVAVYPNPTNGKYFISMDGFTGDVQFEVLSVDGKVIYVEELSVHNGIIKTMDASTLANGVYYIKLTTNNHSQMHKLIVQ